VLEAEAVEVFNNRYRELFPKIYRYVFLLTGSHPEAEQLTQETFAGLFRSYSSSQSVRNPKALAYRIAHNTCLNHLKREKRMKDIINQGNLFSPEFSANPEENLLKKRNADRLRDGLMSLSRRDRTCLLLHFEGLSYADISSAVGVKQSSIGKILARAAERLAQEVKKDEIR
jgi:RNA polymerase sigma-70 factor (ECF subfamily)